MNKRKTLITMLALVCMLVVGIGFASIANINLKIGGTIQVGTSDFIVKFVDDTASPATYTVKGTNKDEAEVNVSLSSLGETKTVKVVLGNYSTDYEANLEQVTVEELEGDLTLDTDVSVSISYPTKITAATSSNSPATVEIEIVFTLIKTQTSAKSATFNIDFDASPVAKTAA